MPTLHAKNFTRLDDAFGGANGRVQLGEQQFVGRIQWYLGRKKFAWDVAKRVFHFLESRFEEIEDYVRKALVPLAGLNQKPDLETTEIAKEVIGRMRSTQVAKFRIYDVGYSTVSFEAPACLPSACVEVLFDEHGELLAVRLRGGELGTQ